MNFLESLEGLPENPEEIEKLNKVVTQQIRDSNVGLLGSMEYHSAAQKEYSELHAHVTKNSASEREKQAYYYLLNKYILDQLTNN